MSILKIEYENIDLTNDNHLEFLNSLWKNRSELGNYFSFFGMALTFKGFIKLLVKYTSHRSYIVDVNGSCVCWIEWSVYSEEDKKIIEVSQIVAPEYRGKGIGLYILNDFLVNSDADEARLSIHTYNNKALDSFKRMGFEAFEKEIKDRQKYYKLDLKELKEFKIYEKNPDVNYDIDEEWPDDDSDMKFRR